MTRILLDAFYHMMPGHRVEKNCGGRVPDQIVLNSANGVIAPSAT
jgi:hypothetical protein